MDTTDLINITHTSVVCHCRGSFMSYQNTYPKVFQLEDSIILQHFSRVDAPICTMVDLDMFSMMDFFLMIRVYKGY